MLAAALLIVGAAFAVYWNSLSVPFFFDDPAAILENPTIRDLSALGQVLSPPADGSGVSGRPIVNLSLALNYAISGTDVAGYHLTNILLHALCGLALFGCVRRTLLLPSLRARFGGAAFAIATAAALIWTIHPLQTESVTCVIQRTEVLVGLFYLLVLYASIRVMDGGGGTMRWSAVAVAASFIGMASKEVMVSAPLMVLLYDRTFVAGTFAAAWRARRPLYLGLASSWMLLAALVIGMGGTRGEVAGFGVGTTWWSYALKQTEAILLYLKLSVWPHPLVVFYGVDVVTDPTEVWLETLVLASLVVLVLVAVWRNWKPGFAGMWFFAILAPSSSVVPLVSQTVSEHRMYLPLAAVVVLGVIAAHHRLGARAGIGSAAVALALGVLTVRRNTDYRSELAIWNDTVAKVPGNERARVNYALALQASGRMREAFEQFQAALQQNPNLPEALTNLASLLLHNRQPADAIELCERALRIQPNFVKALNNLGTALVQTGRVQEGAERLQQALQHAPNMPEAHCNLADAYTKLQQPDKALAHARRAVEQKPGMAIAHFYLALAHIHRGELQPARAALETAVQLEPGYAEAHSNLGTLYYQSGDARRAAAHYEAAVRARPEFVEARTNLASALFQLGDVNGAIEHFRTAIRLQPGNAEAHFNLGLVLARSGRNADAVAAYEEALRLRPDDTRAQQELLRLRGTAGAPQP